MTEQKMKYTQEMREDLKKMGANGKTVQEIANATGIPLRKLQDFFYDRKNSMPYQRIHTKTTPKERCSIVRARVAKNLTRESVEEATGITVATIYNWEHGRFPECIKKAVKLAKLYGVSVEELVGDPDV